MPIFTKRRDWALGLAPVVGLLGLVAVFNSPNHSNADSSQLTPQEELLDRALRQCRQLRDYTCLFTKQEVVGDKLKDPETMKVACRTEPLSLHIRWVQNAGRIQRALYVEGKHRDGDGSEIVLVEPSNGFVRAFKPKVELDLNGEEAKKAIRYPLTQYEFTAMIERVVRENQRYARKGVLQWDPIRDSRIDGRPTYKLVRHLPTDDGQHYPNACLIIHIDKEWMVPVAIRAYADQNVEQLLEHYTCTKVVLNPGLTEADFRF